MPAKVTMPTLKILLSGLFIKKSNQLRPGNLLYMAWQAVITDMRHIGRAAGSELLPPFEKSRMALIEKLVNQLEDGAFAGKGGEISIANFCAGYYYQAVSLCGAGDTKASAAGKAISYYLQVAEDMSAALPIRYYSQLQAACISLEVDRSWPHFQKMLLKAYSLMPSRGEAIKQIMLHFIKEERWGTAYLYSSFAVAHFLEGKAELFEGIYLDTSFYNWQLLDHHVAICCRLGRYDEAKGAFDRLLRLTVIHPEYFSPAQLKVIHGNRSVFDGSKVKSITIA